LCDEGIKSREQESGKRQIQPLFLRRKSCQRAEISDLPIELELSGLPLCSRLGRFRFSVPVGALAAASPPGSFGG
jgi:hypothetical protein